MNRKPRIAIICRTKNDNPHTYFAQASYIDAVTDNGGFPIIIPVNENIGNIPEYLEIVDGVLLTGGGDVNPLFFGDEAIPEVTEMNSINDMFEIELCKQAVNKNIPVLGICRGHQVVNVALGGTLVQDIKAQWKAEKRLSHSQSGSIRSELTHKVSFDDNSVMYKIFDKKEIFVNSYHHQAVGEIAPNLLASGFSSDGIIEAIESKDGKVIGVQWHPEILYKEHKKFQKLFGYFIGLCEQ